MIKRILLVLMTPILFLTGCQPINNVDLNNVMINNTKVTSSESSVTTSIDLAYNRKQVQDPGLLKVLDLLNHVKIQVQTNTKDSNTASLSGNLILQQGTIPFQLYVDQNEVDLLLDHASKPIQIQVTPDSSTNNSLIEDIQAKLLEPVVNNLPNPKHINVALSNQKVHGTNVSGYDVKAEVYASEIPVLLNDFINNLLKDTTAVSEIVNAINELNTPDIGGPAITTTDFTTGLQDFQKQMNQLIPELKVMNLLSNKNYFKTDIFVDNNLYERKSSTELNISRIPSDIGMGFSGIHLKVDSEVWNINGTVNVSKISSSSYLDENATPEDFLATLDKQNSVLYSVMTSFMYSPSKVVTTAQVTIKNNYNKSDTITVNGLAKGDVVKVYKSSTGGDLLASSIASGTSDTISVKQLGKNAGKVYISVIRSNKAESSRVAVGFAKEVVPPSKALSTSQVKIKNNKNKSDTVTVSGIAKGDVIKVYKAKTGSSVWATSKAAGSTATISIKQLGKSAGKVYVTITRLNYAESSRVVIGFSKE